MPNWKKLIVSGSNAVLNSVTASNGFFGTSSWSVSASNAITASFITASGVWGPIGASSVANATNATTAGNSDKVRTKTNSGALYYPTFVNSDNPTGDYEEVNTTSSFYLDLRSNKSSLYSDEFIGSFIGTASWTANAITASFITASGVWGPFGSNSIRSASFAATASFLPPGTYDITASLANNLPPSSLAYGITSSWAVNAATASGVNVRSTGSNATYYITMVDSDNSVATPEQLFTANPGFVGSVPITANPSTGEITAAGFIGTASLAINAISSSTINTIRTATNATHYLTFVDSPNNPAAAEQLYTTSTNGLMCNPSNSSISASGGFFGTASWASQAVSASATPNALITASVSSNVLTFTKGNGTTFNLTVNTGSGTSPGGSNTHIQFNSASVFSGSANLTYQYNQTSGSDRGRLTHISSIDYASASYDEHNKHSLRITNDPYGRNQYAGIVNLCERLGSGQSPTTIFKFKAGGQSGGDVTLKVLGFKCDYCLALDNGSSKFGGSRVGTLWGAWDWDSDQAPVMDDRGVNGEVSFSGELANAALTLVRDGVDVNLQLDTSLLTYTVYYNLLITVFTQTAFV